MKLTGGKMTTVLVRVIETKQIVGIFWANCMENLWDTIDEVCDPGGCEFKTLSSGGIFWRRTAPSIPLEYDEKKDELRHPDYMDGLNLSECADSALMEEGKWKKIPFANEPGSSFYTSVNRNPIVANILGLAVGG